ncbi:MAG: SURF1 family protein, partial [Methylococcales bacterium]|nr:SURF1 family protein [Methylococcales bacterium]
MFLLVVYVLTLILLLNLGGWQLRRSTEKKRFLQQQQQQTREVIRLTPDTKDRLKYLRYKSVSVTGDYLPEKQFLIDNQIFQRKAGYFILTPLRLKNSQKIVLINRGWLPRHADRRILPEIGLTQTAVNLTGRINAFPSVGLKLKGAEIPTKNWPSVVQVVESAVLAQKLGYDLFSFQIELDPSENNGYGRHWRTQTLMLPEKHTAYAIQWFG